MTQINSAMIAQYLWIAHKPQPADEDHPIWEIMNRLAWELQMELPSDVWIKVIRTFQPESETGLTHIQALWEVFAAVRSHKGLGDQLSGDRHFVHHGPNIKGQFAAAQDLDRISATFRDGQSAPVSLVRPERDRWQA